MLLTPRQEAALFAVLCACTPGMGDLLEVQKLQTALIQREQTRRHLDSLARRSKESEK